VNRIRANISVPLVEVDINDDKVMDVVEMLPYKGLGDVRVDIADD
jgi:hypothetical protein